MQYIGKLEFILNFFLTHWKEVVLKSQYVFIPQKPDLCKSWRVIVFRIFALLE